MGKIKKILVWTNPLTYVFGIPIMAGIVLAALCDGVFEKTKNERIHRIQKTTIQMEPTNKTRNKKHTRKPTNDKQNSRSRSGQSSNKRQTTKNGKTILQTKRTNKQVKKQ